MYTNPYSNNSNSIFSNPLGNQQDSDARLLELYQNLERLKSPAPQNQRTVFNDIAEEWKEVSDDERRFIESSKEYMELAQKYQDEFSMFLIEYLGADFLKTPYGKTPEQMLAVIRKKKDEYKNRFAENINEIRDQNSALAEKNNELAKTNEDLQKQLLEIKRQLGGFKDAK